MIGLKKIKVGFRRKNDFQAYMRINNDIMLIVEDIEHLKSTAAYQDVEEEIKALTAQKKDLENYLVELEEKFYDVNKGLWIGVAYDLESETMEPFLLYLAWNKLHNHFDVYGTSGYGKSRLMALMMRQMIKFGWSLMAIDPKGGEKQEVAQWVYDFAAEAGKNEHVMRIMTTYPDISDKGNILFGLGNDEISSMCSSLTVSGTGAQSSDEMFFSGQVYRTTMAILNATTYLEKAAYTTKEINEQIRKEVQKYIDFKEHKNTPAEYTNNDYNFYDISKIALTDIVEKRDKTIISPFNRTLLTFRELSYFSNYDRLKELHQLVIDYPLPTRITEPKQIAEIKELKRTALISLEDVVNKEKAFFEKIGDSLSILLSQLAYGPIGQIMCDIRINPILQKIRDKEGVIIIFQPAPMRFEKVSEMMIKCYTRMFLSLFGTVGATGRGIHKRVAMIVDEAKPMMFPGIEEIYNKARQLGMTIGALYQSRSDMKFKLGEILSDIVQDNTGTTIMMKQGSFSSCEETAKGLGTKKVAINVNMREQDGGGGRSTVVFEDREIASAGDIDGLGIGEGIIKHYGKKYYAVFPYQKDPMPINVVMPKLEAEELFEAVEGIENSIKSQMYRIEEYNIDVKNRLEQSR